jgi:hypothetical protein
MVEMIRDPAEPFSAPRKGRWRYIHSVQFAYTSVATGALELTTDTIAPPQHPFIISRAEVDVEGINPSAIFNLYIEWEAGSEYENHSYHIDTWTGAGAEHHAIRPNTLIPIPPGAHFRLTISNVQVDTVIKVHCAVEWV